MIGCVNHKKGPKLKINHVVLIFLTKQFIPTPHPPHQVPTIKEEFKYNDYM